MKIDYGYEGGFIEGHKWDSVPLLHAQRFVGCKTSVKKEKWFFMEILCIKLG